jgi:hypothetical protein
MNLPTLILTGLLTGFGFAAEQADLVSRVDFIATELRKVIDPNRWTITHDSNSIRIESTFELEIRHRVSPALSMAPPDKTKYRIDLRFAPQLSKEEFLRISKERVERAAISAYGAQTKEAYSDSLRYLRDHPLPRYSVPDRMGKVYSVYFTSTDSVTLSFGPVGLYAEARGVEGIVDSHLWPNTP